jgi:hypothetical protein
VLPFDEDQRNQVIKLLKTVFDLELKDRSVRNKEKGGDPVTKYSIVLLSLLVIADNLEAQSLNAQSQLSLTGGSSSNNAVVSSHAPSLLLTSEVSPQAAMKRIQDLELTNEELHKSIQELVATIRKQREELNLKNAYIANMSLKDLPK